MLKAWANRHRDNIRGLLGTLHEVLWPDSGWVPVQVTDLIEPKRVKMSFRKAMLRVHPDKVKSAGGNTEQQYIADQVFDTLNQVRVPPLFLFRARRRRGRRSAAGRASHRPPR